MTEHIRLLRRRYIEDKSHHSHRQPPADPNCLAAEFACLGLTDIQRSAKRFSWVLKQETPVVYPEDRIALLRTVPVLPEIFTPEEWSSLRSRYYIHEQGKVCNIVPDYRLLLDQGFDEARTRLASAREKASSDRACQELDAMERALDDLTDLAERYRKEALRVGNRTVATVFSRIPTRAPESFLEALQFLRLLHFGLWASFNYHNTLGRFDQYMLPYYRRSQELGMTREEGLELLEEFFLSCNKDSDLYTGMQQGDNGQSLVLGGLDKDGNDCYNELSELCLTACGELCLIDPKINLRVSKKTPISVYESGTQLTQKGLGFPQYTNDDVIIPCLLGWGYGPEDAYNYAVAACWELIIPGRGMDIPNINGLSFTACLNEAMDFLPDCESFQQFLDQMKAVVGRTVGEMVQAIGEVYMEPAPLMSLLMEGCLEAGRDISLGSCYNNFGFHGTGLSTAVDSLAAVRQYVFDEKRIGAGELLEMTRQNFAEHPRELHLLRYEAPKMGDDIDWVDDLATQLLDTFADEMARYTNSRGGIYRAGTGSAMYYVTHAQKERATPDGRRVGEVISCNYSPSVFLRGKGPISVIKSFAKPHLERVANGGPLTIELHNSVFRTPESIGKVARYVKSFLDMGGHQLQINAVNAEILRDAKVNPERYPNLIVRVWGWSGYFVELDEVYQDHILQRAEFRV